MGNSLIQQLKTTAVVDRFAVVSELRAEIKAIKALDTKGSLASLIGTAEKAIDDLEGINLASDGIKLDEALRTARRKIEALHHSFESSGLIKRAERFGDGSSYLAKLNKAQQTADHLKKIYNSDLIIEVGLGGLSSDAKRIDLGDGNFKSFEKVSNSRKEIRQVIEEIELLLGRATRSGQQDVVVYTKKRFFTEADLVELKKQLSQIATRKGLALNFIINNN